MKLEWYLFCVRYTGLRSTYTNPNTNQNTHNTYATKAANKEKENKL